MTLPGLTRVFRDKQESRCYFCTRIFSNSFYHLASFPAHHNRRPQTYTYGSFPQPLPKNELDHYHLLSHEYTAEDNKWQLYGIRRQNMDFVFFLPISILPTGCTEKQASSDSYSYEYEPEGTLLHPHAAYLTIFSLLHPIDNAAISLSLHGNVLTKPVVST